MRARRDLSKETFLHTASFGHITRPPRRWSVSRVELAVVERKVDRILCCSDTHLVVSLLFPWCSGFERPAHEPEGCHIILLGGERRIGGKFKRRPKARLRLVVWDGVAVSDAAGHGDPVHPRSEVRCQWVGGGTGYEGAPWSSFQGGAYSSVRGASFSIWFHVVFVKVVCVSHTWCAPKFVFFKGTRSWKWTSCLVFRLVAWIFPCSACC